MTSMKKLLLLLLIAAGIGSMATLTQGCSKSRRRGFANVNSGTTTSLQLTDFTVISTRVGTGTNINYTYAFANGGPASTGSLQYRIYLSNNQINESNYQGAGVIPIGPVVTVGVVDPGFIEAGSVSDSVGSTNGVNAGPGFVALVAEPTGNSPRIVSPNRSITIQ
jgi:hypothetical protein